MLNCFFRDVWKVSIQYGKIKMLILKKKMIQTAVGSMFFSIRYDSTQQSIRNR